MSRLGRIAAAGLLLACAEVGLRTGSGVGHFVFAGPAGGSSEAGTVRWRYGFQFSVDPKSVRQVKLSCGEEIPGSTFVVKDTEIHAGTNRTAFWEGPALPLTKDAVPWLFAPETTSAECEAVVSRPGLADAVERAPVTFTGAVKQATLAELRTAGGLDRGSQKK
jgi:hypothetical protein